MRPNWIDTLLENGQIAYSRVNKKDLQTLQTLELVKIVAKGSRRAVHILEYDAFTKWVDVHYPAREVDETAAQRAQNIMRGSDSKLGKTSHVVQPIILKWFDPDPGGMWAKHTADFGVCSLTSDNLSKLDLPVTWWLLTVENWESFYMLSYMNMPRPLIVLYLGGNPAEVILETVSQLTPLPEVALHFGDYDWSGLQIFDRLRQALPSIKLYTPENLEDLFLQFGKRSLVDNQSPVQLEGNEDVVRVSNLISRFNAGLEQEIVSPPTLKAFSNSILLDEKSPNNNQKLSEPTWGMHINRTSYESSTPPSWVDMPLKEERWKKRGVIVWDRELIEVARLTAQQAVELYTFMQSSDNWKTEGMVVGEPATRIKLGESGTQSEVVLINNIQLSLGRSQEFFDFLQRHSDLLKQIAYTEEEEKGIALAKVYSLLLNLKKP